MTRARQARAHVIAQKLKTTRTRQGRVRVGDFVPLAQCQHQAITTFSQYTFYVNFSGPRMRVRVIDAFA